MICQAAAAAGVSPWRIPFARTPPGARPFPPERLARARVRPSANSPSKSGRTTVPPRLATARRPRRSTTSAGPLHYWLVSLGVRRLDEPPDAGPHVRWCERGRGNPAPYSIGELSR